MERRHVSENETTFWDHAGLVFLGGATLLCALLALVGLDPAAWALPFLAGALTGDGLFYLTLRSARHSTLLAVVALATVVLGLVVSYNLWTAWLLPAAPSIPWEIPAFVERFALGITLGFGGIVLSTVVFPGFFSPQTWEEAVDQRRAVVRGMAIVAGILLALLLVLALIMAFAAFVVYISVRFAG
ncbi:hypothetical protein RxyAA322_22780 [Rubrobacter xylanophilus]|uniref:Uncharacterized protein n=1 Tax=Rubrobacter xylanophilus TaxID=49319 RepID=A0A510HKJ8_9ACTN|nr:hypothetical protein [Rubrobacter xylanophilus]BBL80424.1 hypothetical protein RxyAA322_22780 [Rubrobacter xylanophilus]